MSSVRLAVFSFLICSNVYAGTASWYDTNSACGKKTNNHEGCPTADGSSLFALERSRTPYCASNDYPLGTKLKVVHNEKEAVCIVKDRGGFKKYGRIIDLAPVVFEKLASLKKGIIEVKVYEYR